MRDSCALPYQINANGRLSSDRKSFAIHLKAGNAFGKKSAGVPFLAYASGIYKGTDLNSSLRRQ